MIQIDKSEQEVAKQAIVWVKKNKQCIIQHFADIKQHPPSSNPQALFMAGSPGAGKTEFVKGLVKGLSQFKSKHAMKNYVIVDADLIKMIIPYYKGRNSNIIQGASSLGVEKILDYVFKHQQSFILDGTFANLKLARNNIGRALKRKFAVGIFYVYQNPILAWQFTKAREKEEGRRVPKDIFVQSLFRAKQNVELIKQEFGSQVEVHLVKKNFDNAIEKIWFNININKIDSFLKITYNSQTLMKELK